ncbi:MAG: anthrax toxin-like adenylyl cyclase domain-containing protein, partial [Janthinobacterium lividum]
MFNPRLLKVFSPSLPEAATPPALSAAPAHASRNANDIGHGESHADVAGRQNRADAETTAARQASNSLPAVRRDKHGNAVLLRNQPRQCSQGSLVIPPRSTSLRAPTSAAPASAMPFPVSARSSSLNQTPTGATVELSKAVDDHLPTVSQRDVASIPAEPTAKPEPVPVLQASAYSEFHERSYLTHGELGQIMPVGSEAIRLSGLVPDHVLAIQNVARELDTVLAFRAVNADSAYWIEHGKAPVKDLLTKQKTEKGGMLGGLLLSDGGRKETNITSLDAEIFGGHLSRMIEEGKLEWQPNSPQDEADPSHFTVVVKDVDKDKIYKLRLNIQENRFSVYRQDGGAFKPVAFKGREGAPITADYDAFDYYPRLKNQDFAGHKKIGAGGLHNSRDFGRERFRRIAGVVMDDLRPQRKLSNFVRNVMDDVLELQDVRSQKGLLGRLSSIDDFIRISINKEVRQRCDYPHDVVMHGKEKRNTQYPELCER